MEHELPKHEKIRFRRDEITDLGTLPSAAGPVPKATRPRGATRARSVLARVLASILCLSLLVVGAVYAVAVSGIGSERLRITAEKELQSSLGKAVAVSSDTARLTFDATRLLALEMEDVKLTRVADGATIVDAGVVRFGLHVVPLLSGHIVVSDATISDARITAFAPATKSSSDWTASLRNARGLIEPDNLSRILFDTARRTIGAVQSKSMQTIELENIDLILPRGGEIERIRIADATIAKVETRGVSFSAEADIDGRPTAVEGRADLDSDLHRIVALQISASVPASTVPARDAALIGPWPSNGNSIGTLKVELSGVEGSTAETSRIDATVALKDSALDLGRRGMLAGDLDAALTLAGAADKIDIRQLRARIGRSVLDFQGAIGLLPATGGAGEIPAYRFALFSRKSSISPEGSPERALEASIRVAGKFQPSEDNLMVDEIILDSGAGEALGTVSVRLAGDRTPGIAAAFSVRDMPVARVKQLWPWFAARSARQWVVNNLFGGQVKDGRISYQVAPGRLSTGKPITEKEVSGTFAIEGTRFDTAGLIPPVRDAVGIVDFRGNDVDISLSSGTVFLPSGRTVAASVGKLSVRDGHIAPVIGALDIDVAGDAPAVAELASYDPINAMRFVGLAPDDFAGQVSGNVKADIPLQKGIDSSKLDWHVALDYEDLSIAKPVSGQMVTEAEGSIAVERTHASIAAKAKLNGVPAEIDAVEPLGKAADFKRERLVSLLLDDEARDKLVPGLAGLVSGPVKVKLDAEEKDKQKFEVDLTAAVLDIPWAGWSKGAGIAADLSFTMEKTATATTLSDFSLSGKSFGVGGSVTLSDGNLSEAKFSSVKLNRDDAVALSIKRTGKAYAVKISGDSLDARSLIKQFTAETGTAKASKAGPVSVDLDVKTLIGFHGERLSGVTLAYSASGGRTQGLDISATARSGKKISIQNSSKAGGRAMQIASADAGALLRFLDIYEHMEGGKIDVSLKGGAEGPMTGQVDARDFWLVNEPRLSSMVSTTPAGDKMSLNEAVKKDIDTTRAQFERGFTEVERGDGYLKLANGVLRGPLIGTTFQGTLYDKQGNMDMTGTFMPAYGINRIFGEIPLIGALLGNGRDRGLIGVTFKLEGDADSPVLQINPLSVIAPGIFRSIFEFR